MKAVGVIVLILATLFFYFKNQNDYSEPVASFQAEQAHMEVKKAIPKVDNSKFRCDGRTHCSHMTSCEEAMFFIKNCPNTKMDGNNDGIPCEKQWCRH